jgi:hypothetical protein
MMYPGTLATAPSPAPPAARRPAVGARSLAPREHGAYGQLGLPLLTALAMGHLSAPAALLTVASTAAFFAHEPLLLVAGQRGTRALREEGARARRRLLALGALTTITGGLGVALAPESARIAVLIPLGLAALLAPFILKNQEKSAPGELLAAAALSSAAIPVSLAAGVSGALTASAWLAWCLTLAASTFAVRSVVAHARGKVPLTRRLVAPALALAVDALAWKAGLLAPAAAIGALPMLLLALTLAAQPPSPRSLKKVGWGLVASSLLLGLALAVGAHLSHLSHL